MSKITEFTNNHNDLDELDLEAIGEHIKEGYSSGHLNDDGKHIYWELKVNVWQEE